MKSDALAALRTPVPFLGNAEGSSRWFQQLDVFIKVVKALSWQTPTSFNGVVPCLQIRGW